MIKYFLWVVSQKLAMLLGRFPAITMITSYSSYSLLLNAIIGYCILYLNMQIYSVALY